VDQDLPHPRRLSFWLICDECYEVNASVLVIVPGDRVVMARCDYCWRYGNPREFAEVSLADARTPTREGARTRMGVDRTLEDRSAVSGKGEGETPCSSSHPKNALYGGTPAEPSKVPWNTQRASLNPGLIEEAQCLIYETLPGQ
jgi:hypothetical protein